MIGNDIIWLRDPFNQGRVGESRLKQRILCPSESEAFELSAPTDRLLWSLWAAKEGAFKAFSRQNPSHFFHPQEFVVSGWNAPIPVQGTVIFQSHLWAVTWHHAKDWVHAVVHPLGQRIWSRVGRWAASESFGTREWATRRIRSLFGDGGRVEAYPPVYHRSKSDRIEPISLSHDGPLAAVALLV